MAMTQAQQDICLAYRKAHNQLEVAPTADAVRAAGEAEAAARDALLAKLDGTGGFANEWNTLVDKIKEHDTLVRKLAERSAAVEAAKKSVLESAGAQAVLEMKGG